MVYEASFPEGELKVKLPARKSTTLLKFQEGCGGVLVRGQCTSCRSLRAISPIGHAPSNHYFPPKKGREPQPAGTCPPPPTGEKQPRPHGFRCSHGSKRAPALPGVLLRGRWAQYAVRPVPSWPAPQGRLGGGREPTFWGVGGPESLWDFWSSLEPPMPELRLSRPGKPAGKGPASSRPQDLKDQYLASPGVRAVKGKVEEALSTGLCFLDKNRRMQGSFLKTGVGGTLNFWREFMKKAPSLPFQTLPEHCPDDLHLETSPVLGPGQLGLFIPESLPLSLLDSTTICQRGLIEETGPARQISDLRKVSRGAFRAGGCPSSLASSGEQTHSPHLYPSPSSSSPSSWEGPPANSITPRGRPGIPAHKLRAASAVFQEATYKSLWLTERETPHSLLLCLSPSHALSPCKAQGY
ncbi:PREDICTED: uncharacterized protein LOC105539004 [Mandrillus leucophaeus]|uniref:uncharacterized protein LOC105539004 n=1 Tax=Mandrillus leucophaeus TaxID=9568 RepID=UPI0005F5290F|nr:PREDICTED: uncharacterized protein LOC105539004 [Mandrillus leucophaeus]